LGSPIAHIFCQIHREEALQTYSTPTSNGPSTAESGSTTEQAKEKAREQAQQAAGQAKSTLRTHVDERSTQAGERVGGFASDVRSVGEQLREQGKDQPAKLAEQAADRAERLGDYLKRTDGDRILNDVEDFGRRQPWAVIAGGLALGLVASRFLKASSSNRFEQRSQSYRQLPARTYETTPATTGIQTGPVTTGPVVPPTPETTTPGYGSSFEGSR
jgi:ElaB/YqjD/DUF883 family membrane-anchored ribosome-binding protein